MRVPCIRDGYVFLISVLAVGVIGSAVVGSLVLLGMASRRTAFALQQSSQAFGLAHACAERGLMHLKADAGYAGGDSVSFAEGTCDILLVGGYGNEHRTICAEGTAGNAVRRLEIVVSQVQPVTRIASWQEVEIFSFCEYP